MFGIVFVALATLLGVAVRYTEWPWVVLGALFGLLLVALVISRVGKDSVKSHPRLATLLIQSWYLVPFVAVTFSTALTTYLAIELPDFFSSSIDEAEKDTVSGVIMGAVSALIGAALLDNAKDPSSKLWPDQVHKTALAKAFSEAGAKPEADSGLYHAVFSDVPPRLTVRGWTFSARWQRATVIAKATKSKATS